MTPLRLVLAVSAAVLLMQAPAPKPPSTPADEAAVNAAAAIKDPDARVEALIAVVHDYPRAVYIRNVVFYLMRTLKPMSGEPEHARILLNRFVDGTASASAYARSEFYYGIARDCLSSGLLLDRAADLAEKGVALLNEADYLDNERRTHEQKEAYFQTKDPSRTAEPFSIAEAVERYRAFRAGSYATLGRVYFKMGRGVEADRALTQAYAVKPIMEAALGLADIAEKSGRIADSFDYLANALLTGRLPADGIARVHTLYRTLHGGQLDGLEADLDARYRRGFHNPLTVERYTPPRARAAASNPRAVLAEFVTGAGCEPCVSVDLAFDAALDRYSRKDMILLVYPMHAPTSDPMSNASAQARHAFYATNSAPTVFLDGRKFDSGEGSATEAARVSKTLDAGILTRLDAPADARLTVTATRTGATVQVIVAVDGIRQASPDLRLHLALVEDEISYSGENGLRFHPMVVRNLARTADAHTDGFPIPAAKPASVAYAFDLDEIAAANLRYYDEYRADLKQRTGIDASFKETRNVINPERVSVIAFVQDDRTDEVLQAASVKVTATAIEALQHRRRR